MKNNNILTTLLLSLALVIGSLPLYSQINSGKDTLLLMEIEADSEREFTYYFLEAIRLKHKGDKDAAFDLFKHCVQLDSSKGAPYYELGALYMDMNKLDKATDFFTNAVVCDTTNYWFNEALFFALYSQSDRADEAMGQLELMVSRFPTKTNLQFQLMELYSQVQEYDKMIAILDGMESRVGKSEQLSMEKFRVFLLMGEESKAFDEINSLVETYPNDLRYQVVLANIYLKYENKKMAYKTLNKVIKKDPDNAMAIYALANYYNETGESNKYNQQLKKVIQNSQADSELKLNLLRQLILQSADNEDMVCSMFDMAIEVDPTDDEIPMLYAQYLFSIKRGVQAKPVLKHILEIDPTNTATRLMLLSVVITEDDYKGVIDICEAGILASPSTLEFYYYLAIAYNQAGSLDEVLRVVNQALVVVDEATSKELISDFYALKGDVYHSKNEMDKLYACYEQSLSYFSSNLPVLNNYAYYLSVERKELDRAKEMSKQTVDAEPTNSTYLDTYAWILFELREYPQARVYIDMALDHGGDESGVIIEHAGDIYYKLGEKDKALEFWNKAALKGDGSDNLKVKIQRKKYISK